MKRQRMDLISCGFLSCLLAALSPPFITAQDVPPIAIENYELGEQAYQRRKFTEAADYLLKSYDAYPNSKTAYFLSSAYLEAGDLANAKKFAETALRENPALAEPDRSRCQNNLNWLNQAKKTSSGGSVEAKADNLTQVAPGSGRKPTTYLPSSGFSSENRVERVTKGNLLWYKDASRNGTSEVSNPKTIGYGGWQAFKNVFAGDGGMIYAITLQGDLLRYIDAKRDGTGEVAQGKVVGRGGWQYFHHVLSGGDRIIYAVNPQGDLLWYKDTGGGGANAVVGARVIGRGGWQAFKNVFSSGNGNIYAITAQGDLIWYKDAKRDGTGEVAHGKVIGHGGWHSFKHVFSGGKGAFYAVSNDGDLLWYKDDRGDGTAKIADPKIIGRGGWQGFKHVFSGGNGIIYAVTAD